MGSVMVCDSVTFAGCAHLKHGERVMALPLIAFQVGKIPFILWFGPHYRAMAALPLL